MKVRFIVLAAITILVGLIMVSCTQAAPVPPTQAPPASAPAPTAAPAPPTQAPALTTAPAAPTAVPAPKVTFPEKGKPIMMIMPYGAGGATDVQGRILAPLLEKELGVPVEVVNKPEAGAQVGLTALAQAKPDGYTIGYTLIPNAPSIYLDPERKAVFDRKSFAPIALHGADPHVVVVKSDSPYKSLNDLMDDIKAKPGKLTGVVAGVLGDGHLALLQLLKITGADAAIVNNTSGGAGPATMLLGGHVDFGVQSLGNWTAQIKSGDLRALAVLDKTESPYLPGVKTAEAQGYKVYFTSSKGLSAPAGTPKEIIDILAGAIRRAMDTPEHKKKMQDMWMNQLYMNSAEYAAFWDEGETMIKPLLEMGRKK